MNDDSVYFIGLIFVALLGVGVGILLHVQSLKFDSNSPENQIKLAIEVCEHDLPRYKHCEITGVVKEK